MRRAADEDGYQQRARGDLLRVDDKERLPWLEPEEDDEDDERGTGLAAGGVLTLLLGIVAVLCVLGAGVWWLLGRHQDSALVPDGSIIEAPAGPYKVRPADAGGTQVSGTGDVSFAVAEGEDRVGRIAGEGSSETIAGSAGAVAGPVGAIAVQIGAYASQDEANDAWTQLSGRIAALQGRGHRVLQGSADAGPVFRLQVLAGGEAEAETLCDAIRAEGGDCQVKG